MFKGGFPIQLYSNFASLPATGNKGFLYITTDTNTPYYWNGSVYKEIINQDTSYDGEVQYYNDLPTPASSYTDQTYYVREYDVLTPLKLTGFYYSDGSNWLRRSDKQVFTLNAFTGANKLTKTNGSTREIVQTAIEIDGSDNLDLKSGGFKDDNVTTAVKLGSSTDTSFNTTKKDIIGAVNELKADKDSSGGYVGLTAFKVNMRNVADTFTSFFTNTNTASRTYTLPDKDGDVAMLADISASSTLDGLNDTNLTTPADNSVLQYDSSSNKWINTATTQLKTDLSLVKGDVALGNVPNTDCTNANNISSGTLDEARLPNDIDHEKVSKAYISSATAVTVATTTPTIIAQVASVSVAAGDKVLILGSGDMNTSSGGDWMQIAPYRDSTAIGKFIYAVGDNSSTNVPFSITHIDDNPGSGTYTYSIKANRGYGSATFGESGNGQAPTLVVLVLKA